jgi:prevent-host-death family protein
MNARIMDSTTFQRSIGATIDAVRMGGETIVITSHGRPQMALLPYASYARLTGDDPLPLPPAPPPPAPRTCKACGQEIVGRAPYAVYCRACAAERDRSPYAWQRRMRAKEDAA